MQCWYLRSRDQCQKIQVTNQYTNHWYSDTIQSFLLSAGMVLLLRQVKKTCICLCIHNAVYTYVRQIIHLPGSHQQNVMALLVSIISKHINRNQYRLKSLKTMKSSCKHAGSLNVQKKRYGYHNNHYQVEMLFKFQKGLFQCFALPVV